MVTLSVCCPSSLGHMFVMERHQKLVLIQRCVITVHLNQGHFAKVNGKRQIRNICTGKALCTTYNGSKVTYGTIYRDLRWRSLGEKIKVTGKDVGNLLKVWYLQFLYQKVDHKLSNALMTCNLCLYKHVIIFARQLSKSRVSDLHIRNPELGKMGPGDEAPRSSWVLPMK